MKLMLAILWKEWRVAVDTPLGYVVATAFLLASGFFFGNNLFLIGQADMRGWFASLPLLFMFFIPAIGMRMLAEESRSGTFELLATLPVRSFDIVAGKLLALVAQLAALILLTLFYPATLSLLGNLDGGQIFASYIAALLLAAAFGSICLFASSLTKNAVVAYVIGFAMLLGFFLLAQAAPKFSGAVQHWLGVLSPVIHYQEMLRGVMGIEDVVFMLGVVVIFAALTIFQIERRQWR